MLTKAQVKDIRSLAQHKYREERGAFLVEGDKMAAEWLRGGARVEMIVAVPEWLQRHEGHLPKHPGAQVIAVTGEELARVSALQTPNQVLLVVGEPAPAPFPGEEWCLVLDEIRDPGNMGTIIRIADWFGIGHVVASPGSAGFYNPKVVQAAMGGHLRVQLHTAELGAFLGRLNIPVVAAVLQGRNVYEMAPFPAAALLIGNESKGISGELLGLAGERVTIPGRGGAESLNAAVSAGILCALLVR